MRTQTHGNPSTTLTLIASLKIIPCFGSSVTLLFPKLSGREDITFLTSPGQYSVLFSIHILTRTTIYLKACREIDVVGLYTINDRSYTFLVGTQFSFASDEAKPSALISSRLLCVLWVVISQSKTNWSKPGYLVSGCTVHAKQSNSVRMFRSTCQISSLTNLSFFEKLLFCLKEQIRISEILQSATPSSG